MPAAANLRNGHDPDRPSRPSTLKAHVYSTLYEAIISGRYQPGSRLNESQLAREFNISRIPIREALVQLQEHGLVMNHERRGMFVTKLEDENVQQINSVRIVLEAEAIKLARANMNRQIAAQLTGLVVEMENQDDSSEMNSATLDLAFHSTVWEAAGNPYLSRTLNSLSTVLFAHTALRHSCSGIGRWRLNHHRRLLEVVLGTSDMSPELAMIEHLSVHYTDPGRFSSFAKAAEKQPKTVNST